MTLRRMAPLLIVAAAGCGPGLTPQPPPQSAAGGPAAPAEDAITMQLINLYMHDTRPTLGEAQRPTLWVQAGNSVLLDEHTWAFEDARAVIYGRTEDTEIVLDAKRGRFEEDRGAQLEGGVRAQIGAMTIELEDIVWTNPQAENQGIARSDNPVRVNDPALQLQAGALRLYPETKTIVLTDVEGTIRFEKEPVHVQ